MNNSLLVCTQLTSIVINSASVVFHVPVRCEWFLDFCVRQLQDTLDTVAGGPNWG